MSRLYLRPPRGGFIFALKKLYICKNAIRITFKFMNMKKFTLISVSLILAAASAFAWTKKSENTGNLGRMYVSLGGGVNMAKVKADGKTLNPTGGYGEAVINAPVFKPGVNAFRDIKWAGVDANAFFNYDYSGKFTVNDDLSGVASNTYSVGVGLTPYLNIETKLPALKAIKPFGIAYAGYAWNDVSSDQSTGTDGSSNYFIYGVGGGVEFVILDQLSFTPTWQWRGNAESGKACYQVVTAELAYWFTEQFCFSAFWTHNFGYTDTYIDGNGDPVDANYRHGDIIGLKFKIGFNR